MVKTQLQGLEIKKTTVNLNEELLIISKLFESQRKAKRINLSISIAENENIIVDRESIQIVFRNIISNAIKFTPLGGKISISSKQHNDDLIQLEVSDSGIGIPPKNYSNYSKLVKKL